MRPLLALAFVLFLLGAAWVWLPWWMALLVTLAVVGGPLLLAAKVAGAAGETRPLVYVFQHYALRDAVFGNHPELARALDGGPGAGSIPLLHIWSLARVHCEDTGRLPEGSDELPGALDEDMKLFEAVRIDRRSANGFTVHTVTMPEPRAATEAHFAAIATRDGEPRGGPSTRYLLLERSFDGSPPALCEWFRDGSRANYGPGPAPDAGTFTDAVFTLLSAPAR